MKGLEILISILGIIGTVWAVLGSYKIIFGLLGFFKYRKFRPTQNYHSYALCVPARNEEKVIVNLLESVANQDYPLDKLTVFVVANNCTDETAKKAREWSKNSKLKVVVYERDNDAERTKGFALKYLFEQIQKEYGIGTFDGYFVFDADNVILKNYVTKMNEAFDEGNKIITSFRNSKNVGQNWISFSYAMHWMRTCLMENRGKGVLNQACRIQGTGFLFANELVKNGWKYTTLTEDRSFCSDAVVQNYSITYCDEAIFYDEQPYKLKIAIRQRIRWAKGHLQSSVENCPKLLKNIFSFGSASTKSYDCFFLNFPKHIEGVIRKILKFSLEIAVAVIVGKTHGIFYGVLSAYLTDLAGSWFGNIALELLVFIKYGKRIEKGSIGKRLFHIFMFPFFDIIGKWSTYIALFKHVEWKPIPHDTVMDIEKLQKT